MATGHRPRAFDQLTPEGQAKVEAIRAGRNQPGFTDAEVGDRERIAVEFHRTGKIATTGEPLDLGDDLRFRRFTGQLREHREALGMSLADLSERSGLDQSALSRLENGRGNPTFATLSRHRKAPGVVPTFGFEVA